VELFAAITTQGPEDITGKATGVHAHHHGLIGLPLSLYQREVFPTLRVIALMENI
jgi:hypothetical protein